jgi:hypothetical protein
MCYVDRSVTMTGLEDLSPDLASTLQRASAAKQRAAALVACEFAISRAGAEHPLVDRTLKTLRAAGVLLPEEKAELDTLAAQLDEDYFALQEAAEEERASTEGYLKVFGQARAVAALACAADEDALRAATEAIYEATATADDKEALLSRILSALQ